MVDDAGLGALRAVGYTERYAAPAELTVPAGDPVRRRVLKIVVPGA